MLFPLLFKKKLSDMGRMPLSSLDTEKLKRIDSYLMHDPFTFDFDGVDRTHPWAKVDSDAWVPTIAKRFYPDSQ
jgi:hypothetical protein